MLDKTLHQTETPAVSRRAFLFGGTRLEDENSPFLFLARKGFLPAGLFSFRCQASFLSSLETLFFLDIQNAPFSAFSAFFTVRFEGSISRKPSRLLFFIIQARKACRIHKGVVYYNKSDRRRPA